MPQGILQSPVTSLIDEQAQITAALDSLLQGY
jgi:hypothetical protein